MVGRAVASAEAILANPVFQFRAGGGRARGARGARDLTCSVVHTYQSAGLRGRESGLPGSKERN